MFDGDVFICRTSQSVVPYSTKRNANQGKGGLVKSNKSKSASSRGYLVSSIVYWKNCLKSLCVVCRERERERPFFVMIDWNLLGSLEGQQLKYYQIYTVVLNFYFCICIEWIYKFFTSTQEFGWFAKSSLTKLIQCIDI